MEPELFSQKKTVYVRAYVWKGKDFSIVSDKKRPTKVETFNIVPTRMVEEAEGNPQKLLAIDLKKGVNFELRKSDERVFAHLLFVTEKRWEHYKNQPHFAYETGDPYAEEFEESLRLLMAMDYGRLVFDHSWWDGFFYTPKGKAISRSFYFGYSDSQIWIVQSYGISPEELYKKLEKVSEVEELETEEVPYYNHEPGDPDEVPVFLFRPTERQFRAIVKGALEAKHTCFSSFARQYFIKKLKLKKTAAAKY